MRGFPFRGLVLLATCFTGCAGPQQPAGVPGDTKAAEVLSAHWAALQRGDRKSAYEQLHPELRSSKFLLKQFTTLHAGRRKAKALPQDIKIVEAQQAGEDVIVSFDVLHVPSEGGEPVAVPPRRKVTLRKTAGTWGLLTSDLLAIGPMNQGIGR
jgi:hypothetical protein